jgi:hypothetical protein
VEELSSEEVILRREDKRGVGRLLPSQLNILHITGGVGQHQECPPQSQLCDFDNFMTAANVVDMDLKLAFLAFLNGDDTNKGQRH